MNSNNLRNTFQYSYADRAQDRKALIKAVEEGDLPAVKRICQRHGTEFVRKTRIQDTSSLLCTDQSLPVLAAKYDHEEIFKFLMEGYDDVFGREVIYTRDEYKHALNNCAKHSVTKMVKTLLREHSYTQEELDSAVRSCDKTTLVTAEVLIRSGGKATQNNFKSAIIKDDVELVSFIIGRGDFKIDTTLINESRDPRPEYKQMDALYLACSYGAIKTIEYCINHGANMHNRYEFGKTAFDLLKDADPAKYTRIKILCDQKFKETLDRCHIVDKAITVPTDIIIKPKKMIKFDR